MRSPADLWLGLVLVACAVLPRTLAATCDCFKTNSSTGKYFAQHQFFDFRSLSQYVNVPTVLSDFNASAAAPATNAYFSSDAWNNFWDIQTWNNSNTLNKTGDATVLMVNSPNNIYIERSSDPGSSVQTYMTMRTARLQGFQSASEIESSSQGFQYVSIRMLGRTRGPSGAVTAMFTYRPPPNPTQQNLVQEADLEIRTVDPATHISLTNQPSWNDVGDIPQATRNVSLPNGRRWTDWAYYRMDWTPGSTTWYVNGQQVAALTFQAPRDPAQLMFNSWSDGGSWSGNMTLHQAAYLQIQWIDVVFNNTDPAFQKSGTCHTACAVDDNNAQPGNPVPYSGGGTGSGGQSGGGSGCQSKKYDQCDGKTWSGCKACISGTTCRFQNDYYSQCL